MLNVDMEPDMGSMYEKVAKLGRGSYGTVYKVRKRGKHIRANR